MHIYIYIMYIHMYYIIYPFHMCHGQVTFFLPQNAMKRVQVGATARFSHPSEVAGWFHWSGLPIGKPWENHGNMVI